MEISKVDLWNCLQNPERAALWTLLDWMAGNGFVGIPVDQIDGHFNVASPSGLKRRDAFLALNSLIPWGCLDPEENPYLCYITTAPSAWSEWIALYDAGELSFLATCSIPLFP